MSMAIYKVAAQGLDAGQSKSLFVRRTYPSLGDSDTGNVRVVGDTEYDLGAAAPPANQAMLKVGTEADVESDEGVAQLYTTTTLYTPAGGFGIPALNKIPFTSGHVASATAWVIFSDFALVTNSFVAAWEGSDPGPGNGVVYREQVTTGNWLVIRQTTTTESSGNVEIKLCGVKSVSNALQLVQLGGAAALSVGAAGVSALDAAAYVKAYLDARTDYGVFADYVRPAALSTSGLSPSEAVDMDTMLDLKFTTCWDNRSWDTSKGGWPRLVGSMSCKLLTCLATFASGSVAWGVTAADFALDYRAAAGLLPAGS